MVLKGQTRVVRMNSPGESSTEYLVRSVHANDFGGASVMSSTNESAKYFKQGDVYFCAAG